MNYAPHFKLGPKVAAFLLAGGMSSRMGKDKALLLVEGKPLLQTLAERVLPLCSELRIVAPRGRYESLGYSIVEDRRTASGPLAGIEAALEASTAEWNLILACDMPNVPPSWLQALIDASGDAFDCILSASNPETLHPLCALWRKTALPVVRAALDSGNRKVLDVVEQLRTQILIPQDPGILANWNSPADMPQQQGEGKANCGG